MNALSTVLRTAQRSYDRLLRRQNDTSRYQTRAIVATMARLKRVEFVDPVVIWHPDNPRLGVVNVLVLEYLPGEANMETVAVRLHAPDTPVEIRHLHEIDPHSLDILVDALERFVRTHGVIRTKKVPS